MSFLPNPPSAPVLLDGPLAEQVARATQAKRVATLAGERSTNPSRTFRDVLLGTRRDQQHRLLQAMRQANLPDKAVERVAECGKHAFVFEHQVTGELRIRHFTCHNRFCLMCQRNYIRRVKQTALSLAPEPQRRLSFLTLTQRAEAGRDLRRALGTMLQSFRRLRHTPSWKARVSGGLYVIEITRGTRNWWHVHIHAVIDTRFWPLPELHSAWAHASRADVHCHIRAVDGNRENSTLRYLNKYLSKPFSDELYQHQDALADFVAATRGRQLIQAIGTWRPAALVRSAHEKVHYQQPDAHDWRLIGELHDLIDDAERGSRRAARFLRKLGYHTIQLRHDAQSEVERWQESRAKAARPPPLFSRGAA